MIFEVGCLLSFFFFQAEDGIRDVAVTAVQTCALPIYPPAEALAVRVRSRRGSHSEEEQWSRNPLPQFPSLATLHSVPARRAEDECSQILLRSYRPPPRSRGS